MAGRVFYIDPLHGSSANNGLTSADNAVGNTGPFGSITDVLWDGDADPAKFGGSGDIYYLVGSTADEIRASEGYSNYSFEAVGTRWGVTSYNNYFHITPNGGPASFIGVNTDLEEDGSYYQINWHPYVSGDSNSQNFNREILDQNSAGEIWRNILWVSSDTYCAGRFLNFTSGGNGPYFVNSKWDWTGPFDNTLNYRLIGSSNPSMSFKNCIFEGPGGDAVDCMSIGAQYGQHNAVIGCVFKGWKKAYSFAGSSDVFYGNIVYNCESGVGFNQGTTINTGQKFFNNLFYNITNDAFNFESGNWTPVVMNNLIVDCGGYAFNCNTGWAPQHDREFCIRKNVIQNATSGLYGPNLTSAGGGIYYGFTGDGLYGNISENVAISGLTLSIDSNHNVTISGFPASALGITGTFDYGARSSGSGFLSSGVSGESSGDVQESEQARVTS